MVYASYSANLITQSSTNAVLGGVILGAILTLSSSLIIQLFVYFLSRKSTKEDRKENFKLELYKLRIDAAQKANQYIFKVYRARAQLVRSQNRTGLIQPNSAENIELTETEKEARDWLDGQALILGKTFMDVLVYLNMPIFESDAEELSKAQKSLRALIKKEFIE